MEETNTTTIVAQVPAQKMNKLTQKMLNFDADKAKEGARFAGRYTGACGSALFRGLGGFAKGAIEGFKTGCMTESKKSE